MSNKWLKDYKKDSLVVKAYEFANKAHGNVMRKNGDPYIEHCLSVAKTIYEWGLDEPTISAALLHDVVEDTKYTLGGIKNEFGDEVTFFVDSLTKIKKLEYTGKQQQAENMRKLIIAIGEDLRVVFIKLADRWHNMSTLDAMSAKKRKRIALETMEIYAPLAYRLGMQWLSGELEDLAFPYIYPEEDKWINKNIKEKYKERKEYAERVKPTLEKELKDNGIIPIKIDARAKRHASLYKKLLRYDMDVGRIYDLVALRVTVSNIRDCYSALGIIHKNWPPLPGRIKDYIAMPKPNGYRSLHTTVFFVDNKITEIQIRTQKMHEEAELGAAAHWAYQQAKTSEEYKKKAIKAKEHERKWVKQLHNWQKSFRSPEEFIDSLKVDFFKDRIFVVTPEHDIIDLPAGSTPVDFAYRIHSEVGHQCVGAKVNGRIVSLDHKLRSGDVVTIMTQKGKNPSPSWLDFVKTSTAREHIRSKARSKLRNILKKERRQKVEFRISTKDRAGLLKDITQVFYRSKVNIKSIHGNVDRKSVFPIIKIACDDIDEKKLEKLMLKIKKIEGVKEVTYKFSTD